MEAHDLPEGWLKTQLNEVGSIVTGKTPSKKMPEFFNGEIPFIKPGDVDDQGEIKFVAETISELGAKTVPSIPKGSIVVTCIGNLGRAAITSERSATNQQINSVIPFDEVDTKYLYYYILTLKNWLRSASSATTVAIINKSKFSTAPVRLASLPEQKVIADKLDSLLAQVENTKARLDRIPETLKRFHQSVLAAAVSGRLTEEWRRLNSFNQYDINELRDLVHKEWLNSKEREFTRKNKKPKTTTWMKKFNSPDIKATNIESWVTLPLESVAEVYDPNPSHRMPQYVDSGFSFISSENILGYAELDFLKGKKITLEELKKQKERYEVTDGTFAFTRIGTIGKSVSLPLPHEYGISHAMAVVTPYQKLIDQAFLRLTVSSESILKQALSGVQSVGVPDLGIGKMKSFQIPLPPLEEQNEIVRRVEELLTYAYTVEQKAQAASERVNKLTQSILAKAFRGELTKDWRAANPDLISGENSAEALLEKIKAEREALKPKKKPRKKKA